MTMTEQTYDMASFEAAKDISNHLTMWGDLPTIVQMAEIIYKARQDAIKDYQEGNCLNNLEKL